MVPSGPSRKSLVCAAVVSLIVACAADMPAAEQPGVTTFTASKIKETRTKAGEATRATREGPEGWSKSPVDPMRLLPVFAPLKLKEGAMASLQPANA